MSSHSSVDGQWMDWTPWSSCSVSCGGGTRERSRDCYLGQFGGANCTGHDHETSTCNPHNCPVNGKWLQWSEWGNCSKECGTGTQERFRICEGPFYGGANCTGPEQEDRDCNTHHCAVDGVFETWSEWTTCTLTCGGGSRFRSRTCHGPFYGGAACSGAWNETTVCNEEECPGQ
ncbi:brain-specific angiogenesis inhibitor 1 [Elysia marginata]|uniref:Brain-specific angiogenesis inhibitor 1 n=1 Tax=Elysia marginata TaxID=1093978 RepID=A0AAV4I7N2_9GAST|nr:brain-specific angiogenesis inhibitor 1 [Elysia marginata]